jgi:hypothetical protein
MCVGLLTIVKVIRGVVDKCSCIGELPAAENLSLRLLDNIAVGEAKDGKCNVCQILCSRKVVGLDPGDGDV